MEDKLQQILIDLAVIKANMHENTKDLAEHKEGVIQNRKRIDALEKVSHEVSGIKKFMVVLMTAFGVIFYLEKFLALFVK